MIDRRQAKITVMQFRGPHFISQFPPTRFPLITAIRMCHFLPVHQLGMAFFGRVEGQNTIYLPTPPNRQDGHEFKFLAEFNRFKFRFDLGLKPGFPDQ